VKYAALAAFVVLLPALWADAQGFGLPWFCKWLCPAGTLEGAVPLLLARPQLFSLVGAAFAVKAAGAAAVLAGAALFHRFFCRVLCPLGAVYGLLNRWSLYTLRVDAAKCSRCGACARACRMGVDPVADPDSPECVRCGDCQAACPHGALRGGWRWRDAPRPMPGAGRPSAPTRPA
jgi:polyferredoxin